MALITADKINKVYKEKSYVHKRVDCTYTVYVDQDGNKYFQIDTYGSEDRKIKNKISQSIQLNKESASKLIEIIKQEFDL